MSHKGKKQKWLTSSLSLFLTFKNHSQHTCNAGAFGQFASGVGNTDAGFVLGTGKLLVKVPPTLRFVL